MCCAHLFKYHIRDIQNFGCLRNRVAERETVSHMLISQLPIINTTAFKHECGHMSLPSGGRAGLSLLLVSVCISWKLF